ncbi:MAG: hypothetical protein M3O30_13030 [Planctomycetota bacterium]|nr:hypothetical protein [Planctomycetota bacterium]
MINALKAIDLFGMSTKTTNHKQSELAYIDVPPPNAGKISVSLLTTILTTIEILSRMQEESELPTIA